MHGAAAMTMPPISTCANVFTPTGHIFPRPALRLGRMVTYYGSPYCSGSCVVAGVARSLHLAPLLWLGHCTLPHYCGLSGTGYQGHDLLPGHRTSGPSRTHHIQVWITMPSCRPSLHHIRPSLHHIRPSLLPSHHMALNLPSHGTEPFITWH